MAKESFDFLLPLTASENEKKGINFHNVPDPLPVEPKVDLEINYNPLAFDDYAVEIFGLRLPEQELLVKWLDLE